MLVNFFLLKNSIDDDDIIMTNIGGSNVIMMIVDDDDIIILNMNIVIISVHINWYRNSQLSDNNKKNERSIPPWLQDRTWSSLSCMITIIIIYRHVWHRIIMSSMAIVMIVMVVVKWRMSSDILFGTKHIWNFYFFTFYDFYTIIQFTIRFYSA